MRSSASTGQRVRDRRPPVRLRQGRPVDRRGRNISQGRHSQWCHSGPVLGSSTPGGNVVNTAIDALAEEGLVDILRSRTSPRFRARIREFPRRRRVRHSGRHGDDKYRDRVQAVRHSASSFRRWCRVRISLKVRPEVSELSNRGRDSADSASTIPGFGYPARGDHHRTRHRPELRNRRAVLQRREHKAVPARRAGGGRRARHAVPLDSFRHDETELVIIVTRYLVPAVASARAGGPHRRLQGAQRHRAALQGRLHSAQLHPGRGGPQGPQGQRLTGPIGFVLE